MLPWPPETRRPQVGTSKRFTDTSTAAGSGLPKTIATLPASSSLSTWSATAASVPAVPVDVAGRPAGEDLDEVSVADDWVAAVAERGEVDRGVIALAEHDEDGGDRQARRPRDAAGDEQVVEAVGR
jgi:hypothetical protein